MFGAKSGLQTDLIKQIEGAMGQTQSIADYAENRGQKALKHGTAGLERAGQYYKTLASGDRTAMAEALGPEIGAIGRQYDAVTRGQAETAGRSGASASGQTARETEKAGQIGNLFMQVRPEAVKGEAQVGQILAGLGLDASKLAESSLGQILSSALGLDTLEQERIMGKGQAISGTIGGLGKLIGSFIPGL